MSYLITWVIAEFSYNPCFYTGYQSWQPKEILISQTAQWLISKNHKAGLNEFTQEETILIVPEGSDSINNIFSDWKQLAVN